jgi:hypothetical protein
MAKYAGAILQIKQAAGASDPHPCVADPTALRTESRKLRLILR